MPQSYNRASGTHCENGPPPPMKLYTKTGDSGETGLADGSRVGKDHLRIRLVGEADELNSSLGLALALFERDLLPPSKQTDTETPEGESPSSPQVPRDAEPLASPPAPAVLRDQVKNLQALLFELGASLAGVPSNDAGLRPSDVEQLENWIDALQASLPSLRHFILPGGCPSAAQFHIARAACRRLERSLVEASQQSHALAPFAPAPPHVAAWINRLSDYLFLLARAVNRHNDGEEQPWRPRS